MYRTPNNRSQEQKSVNETSFHLPRPNYVTPPLDYEGETIKVNIINAGKDNDLKRAQAYYQKAIDAGIINPWIFNTMIKAASDCQNIHMAWEVYQTACSKKRGADHVTHTTMIREAGKHKRLDYLNFAYQQAKTNGLDDGLLFNNTVILALGNCKEFDRAWEIYSELLESDRIDEHTFINIILAATHNNKLDYVKMAYEASNIFAHKKQLKFQFTHQKAIKAAIFHKNRDLLKEFYETAKLEGYRDPELEESCRISLKPAFETPNTLSRPNRLLSSNFSPMAAEFRPSFQMPKMTPSQTATPVLPAEAPSKFNEEKQSHLVSEKEQAYASAVKYGFANNAAHKEIIRFAGENKNMPLALTAYANGLAEADLELHLCMMKAAAQCNRLDFVETAKRYAIKFNGQHSSIEIDEAYQEATSSKIQAQPTQVTAATSHTPTQQLSYVKNNEPKAQNTYSPLFFDTSNSPFSSPEGQPCANWPDPQQSPVARRQQEAYSPTTDSIDWDDILSQYYPKS